MKTYLSYPHIKNITRNPKRSERSPNSNSIQTLQTNHILLIKTEKPNNKNKSSDVIYNTTHLLMTVTKTTLVLQYNTEKIINNIYWTQIKQKRNQSFIKKNMEKP